MVELTLVSKESYPIRAVVEAALHNEYQELLQGLQKTEERVRSFEEKYKMTTAAFLDRYANDEFQHSLDFDEWIGESRMLTHLTEKAQALRSIEIADRRVLQAN